MEFDRAQLERDLRAWIGPLCEAVAPTGFEDEAEELVRSLLADTGLSFETDHLHNLIVHRPGKGPKVAVVAHLDEIGLIVRHIDDRGFLWIETLAGVQPQQLFGKHVIVKTETGHVDGIVNHINPGRPTPCAVMPQDLNDFFVDVGASSRAEAEELGIEVGNPISIQYPTLFLGKDGRLVAGKALDDRACVYQLIELTRLLAGDPEGPDFYAIFSTQEETGGRGLSWRRTTCGLTSPSPWICPCPPTCPPSPTESSSTASGTGPPSRCWTAPRARPAGSSPTGTSSGE